MEVKLDRNLHRERLQVVRRWQLRNQLARIRQIHLLAQQSRAQVEIEAALEVLTDEVLVEGHFAQSFEFLGQVVELAILFVVFFPLLFFLFVK